MTDAYINCSNLTDDQAQDHEYFLKANEALRTAYILQPDDLHEQYQAVLKEWALMF